MSLFGGPSDRNGQWTLFRQTMLSSLVARQWRITALWYLSSLDFHFLLDENNNAEMPPARFPLSSELVL
jgi:hypothetical protein